MNNWLLILKKKKNSLVVTSLGVKGVVVAESNKN